MTKSSDNENFGGHIREFYNGKSIFITGASGFFGTVLLETLLRCCPGIQAVYLLIREKKGVDPVNRKAAIFKKNVFDSLKRTQPNVFDKVYVLSGDVSLPDLGMKRKDMLNVCQNVSIVFHVAAIVRFKESYRSILASNSQGTSYVVELCRKLKNMDALVFTSTAFSNSNRLTEIKETVYRLPFPTQWFLDELNNGTEASLARLIEECYPKWPNTYTFSKALAENVLQENALDIPIGIIRPSIIGPTFRKPYQGYMEKGSGMMTLFIGNSTGLITVIHAPKDLSVDVVPADICANSHLIAAWILATSRSKSPLVVNVVSYGTYEFKMTEMNAVFVTDITEHPLKKSFQTPGTLTFRNNSILYWMSAVYEHYIPAYVMDCFQRLTGRKPRLVEMYKFADKTLASLQYFIQNIWCFETRNFKELSDHLDETDKMMFNASLSGFDPYAVIYESVRNLDTGTWENENEMKKRRKQLARMKMTTTFIKNAGLLCICLLFSFIIFYLIPSIFSLHY